MRNPEKQSRAGTFFKNNVREFGLIVIIVVISILMNIQTGGKFITFNNINNLLSEASVLAILAIGMMMVIITGGIDLSIGATMALSAMVSTSLMKATLATGGIFTNPYIAILLSVVIGTICGFIVGLLVSRLNIFPIIATLGMMYAFRGLTYVISGGSWVLQQHMSKEFLAVATGKFLGINNLIWITAVLYIAAFFFMNYTKTGREIYAVGNDEESARVSGINTKRVYTMAYSIMGAIAGLAGILYVCKYAAAQGETATGYEMNVIAACVLGGVSINGGSGKVQGVLLGALLFGVLQN
ncbi:MAG: ABC transporter permease, partial [Eubacteriales bacterium]